MQGANMILAIHANKWISARSHVGKSKSLVFLAQVDSAQAKHVPAPIKPPAPRQPQLQSRHDTGSRFAHPRQP